MTHKSHKLRIPSIRRPRAFRVLLLALGILTLLTLMPHDPAQNQAYAAGGSYTGSGTATDPYVISDFSDLDSVRQEVASGNSFSGKYLCLDADIQLSSDWAGIGALKEGTTSTGDGTNIMPFSGTLDGKGSDGINHTVTTANGGKPLFAYVREATIRNLDIAGENIDGSGMIRNYVVDKGPSGNNAMPVADISNVTIKSGSTIKGSGIASGYAAAGNTISISDCTVEAGVIIGCDANREKVGSFGGDFNGTIRNCSSAATVKGTNYVGGIMGARGNSMSETRVSGCTFTGQVIATGYYAGGIAGGSYGGTGWGINSAPNALGANIQSCLCSGSVQAANVAGGILGYETTLQAWENGIGYLQDNSFTGTVSVTGATGQDAIMGGIAGQFRGLDKYNIISGNTFAETCGTIRPIGGAGFVDTNFIGHETSAKWMKADGTTALTTYYDTSIVDADGKPANLPEALQKEAGTGSYPRNIKANHNRADDPLKIEGIDPGGGDDPGSGGGDDPGTGGGSGDNPGGSDTATTITVTFTLLGDSYHPDNDSVVHTRAAGNLTTWIARKSVAIAEGSSAWDLMQKAMTDSGLKWQGVNNSQYGSYYISGIQMPGSSTYLREKDNGPNSGWMYMVNGTEPNIGVSLYKLEDGDDVTLFYTDDYTKEQSGEPYSGDEGDDPGEGGDDPGQGGDDDPGKPDDPDAHTVTPGSSYQVGSSTYQVVTAAEGDTLGTIIFTKAGNQKKITVPEIVTLQDSRQYRVIGVGTRAFKAKKIRTVTISKGIEFISKKAFAKSQTRTIILKTSSLNKKSVKGSLKNSKVRTIKVRVGQKSQNKKYLKKYRKIFTKKNAGKKAVLK